MNVLQHSAFVRPVVARVADDPIRRKGERWVTPVRLTTVDELEGQKNHHKLSRKTLQ